MLTHHGFKRRTLVELVRAGFATVERTIGNADSKALGAGCTRITAAGALED